MRWLKFSASLLSIVLLFALILPFLIPLIRYIPQIQKMASDKLGEPVEIAEIKFALLPLPSATLARITLGKLQSVFLKEQGINHPEFLCQLPIHPCV